MLKSFFKKGASLCLILLDALFKPKQIQRSEDEIRRLARETRGISLYDYRGCPVGLKTRREIHRLNLDIEKRDIRSCSIHQDSLLAQYGKLKVPCLRIEEQGVVRWLDQPDEIIAYLQQRFDTRTEHPSQSLI